MTPPSNNFLIRKASGEVEPFSQEKLVHSLREGAGASPELAQTVAEDLRTRVYEGIPTHALYRLAFSLLRKEERRMAARYSLKRAIMGLGPSGFPFEKLVGALLEARGYQTRIGVTLAGACVSHEVDVVAEKDGHRILVECKFHNQPGVKSDVKVALYVQARALDLLGPLPRRDEFWLVTNTKFTSDAFRYAECVGLKPISWDLPAEGNLRQWIERAGIHPITCLTTLKNPHKKALLKRNIVLCRELADNLPLLAEIGIKNSQVRWILEETRSLMEKRNGPAED
jgi:hypothetical protein